MRLIVIIPLLTITSCAYAAGVSDQIKMLQRTEKQVAAAAQASDASALRQINTAFTPQLENLLRSDASFECKMAGNAMQGLIISLGLPYSARKLTALDHDAGEWERNMNVCEREHRLPSKRLLAR